METTRLSSKGQIIIPKTIRNAHQWRVGQEFAVEETEQGVLLRPKSPFPQTTLKDVAGCLKYSGPPRSLADMTDAIKQGALKQWHDCS